MPSDGGCAQVVGQTIYRYGISGNMCYDQTFLYVTQQDTNTPDGCERSCKKKNGEYICTINCGINTPSADMGASWGVGAARTFKTECDDGEVKIQGYCHKLDSYGTLGCPDGYSRKDDKCYKLIKKTCSKTCNTSTWSSWSNWSTTRVIENEYTEVQTKTE